mmetsp:Transcript_20936/g.55447  ORF Transcript_20936/g.55447 Transcript_20936/m.55447 type:complete len:237 (+) Transcript_20936:2-712(+)
MAEPSLSNCVVGNSVQEARLFSRVTVQRTQDQTVIPPRLSVVKWLSPLCTVAGTEQRVDVFLHNGNEGLLGLGKGSCSVAGGQTINLVHELNNTWAVFWFLLHPGTYTICHRPTGAIKWYVEASFHMLPPTPRYCSFIPNPDLPPPVNGTMANGTGAVRCELPTGVTAPYFDGFYNMPAERPDRCVHNCAGCLALGGKCICHGLSGTCDVCFACSDADKKAENCVCEQSIIAALPR